MHVLRWYSRGLRMLLCYWEQLSHGRAGRCRPCQDDVLLAVGNGRSDRCGELQREEKKATIATMLDTAEGKKGDGSAKMAAIGKKQRWDRW
ncbi:hypothetical protein B296_00031553 [Ensete ventricosum]|uniref:Uncharacterized protein n=1 Tax=Ensete ventricosum TaxID=4639 RepID=A0A426YXX1_ENSVE|nr:hypothetical protein B296_00031553 [Ensete ventricosum]